MAAGAALYGFYGDVLGEVLGGGDREEEQRLLRQRYNLYRDLPYQLQAEVEGMESLGPSAYEGIQEDPALRAAQLQALSRVGEIASTEGLDAASHADLAEAQASSAGQERAQRGAILDTFARRGQGNSNAALLASLSAQQGSAQRAGMEGLRAAGDASLRRYQALRDMGSMAGDVRGQDYGVAANRAAAMDRVGQYNAANRQAVQARNTDRRQGTAEGNRSAGFARAAGMSGALGDQFDWQQNRTRQRQALYGGAARALGGSADAAMTAFTGGFAMPDKVIK